MVRTLRLTLPLVALTGCATLDVSLPERSERPFHVAVAVEELPGEDVWQVGYALDRPAAGVEFVGASRAFRRERWGVAVREGEVEWRVDGGRERLCFSRPTGAFSVGFRTWTEPLSDDLALNVAFSEGSRLLHTGHLLVRPLAACGEGDAAPAPHAAVHRFTFATAPGRSVRVLDRVGAGELSWQPGPGDGLVASTYVYFGGLPAVEGEAATAILDPGLPGWMQTDAADLVPRLVERFTAITGTPLPSRPLLFVAWDGDRASGRSVSGGTLPGLLVAVAAGAGWSEEGPDPRRDWFHRIAHEVFHLWDGEAYRPDEEAEWLSEAAADHFAVDAALAFGVRNEVGSRRRLVARANDCLVRLAGRSLVAAGAGDPRARSSCGAVAMAAADGALRRGATASSLADLFRRLFEHAAATGSYGTPAFLGGLQELQAEPGALADLRRLVRTGGAARSDDLLARLLAHAGVDTERVAPEEATADAGTLRAVVRHAVGRCWCGSGEAATCDAGETGRGLTAVAGEPVAEAPRAAWDRLRSAVARGAALPVVLDGAEVTLFCGTDSFDPTWESFLSLAEPPAG